MGADEYLFISIADFYFCNMIVATFALNDHDLVGYS